jgi:hypothetical protein
MDARTYSQTGYDIYFSFSADGGDSFSPNVRVNDLLGMQDAWQRTPAVCVNDSAEVFVAWQDGRNHILNPDVYSAAGQCMGINEKINKILSADVIRLSPNPCRHFFSVRSHRNDIIFVEVFDVMGRSVILKENGNPTFNAVTEIDTHGLPSGLYFVEVVSESNTIVKKVIKVK